MKKMLAFSKPTAWLMVTVLATALSACSGVSEKTPEKPAEQAATKMNPFGTMMLTPDVEAALSAFEGSWQEIKGTEIIELGRDGSFALNDESIKGNGQWVVVNSKNMKFEVYIGGRAYLGLGSLIDGNLHLQTNGTVHEYRKMTINP